VSHTISTLCKEKNLLLIRAAAGSSVFSLDASFGLLATVSASALAQFFDSALSSCGVSCMI